MSNTISGKKSVQKAGWAITGGIYPQENKAQSLTLPIQTAPLPAQLFIVVSQPANFPCDIKVAVGDYVYKGQQIASGKNNRGLVHHASSSGTVTAIGPNPVPNISGIEELCITIATDGEEHCQPRVGNPNYLALPAEEILTIISAAGINGLGGAGFPTHIKLNQPRQIHTLVINACECEPFITADDMLMRERADEIISGIKILLHILKPKKCLVGIEDNKATAMATLVQANNDERISFISVPSKYPSGAEKQLIQILTGVEIPSAKLAVDVGIICQNIATTYAIARAVIYGEPLTSRIVTLTGAALSSPGNFEVLLGTPISDLLQHCGLQQDQFDSLIMGGSLMGIHLPTTQLPIIKTTNCLIASSHSELPPPPPAQACIRCGLCVEACPVSLLPQQLYWFARSKEHEKAQSHHLMDCIECGACAYVCPSHIPLVQYYRATKASIKQEINRHQKAEQSQQRFDFHQQRIEREKALADQRRKQRAELAKQKSSQSGKEGKGSNKAQDAIQAALARVKAKKAEKAKQQANETKDTDT